MSNIPELEAMVERLEAELETAQRHLTYARVAATGMTVDDIVKGTGRFVGQEFKVTFIDARWGGKPWLEAVKRRADGSWGTGVRHLYENWERVVAAPEAGARTA
jgi:hypothetical protein